MKKICLLLLIVNIGFVAKAQDDWIDVALFYSTMQANNTLSSQGEVNRWHGVGFNVDGAFLSVNKVDVFLGSDFLLGWANHTDNNLVDIGLKLGVSVNALDNKQYSLKVMPHISMGVIWNMISASSIGGYYDGAYYQLAMYIPVGVKVLYHHFFVDVYYRAEPLKSSLKELRDEDLDDIYTVIDIMNKRSMTSRLDKSIKPFSLFFAIGYRF